MEEEWRNYGRGEEFRITVALYFGEDLRVFGKSSVLIASVLVHYQNFSLSILKHISVNPVEMEMETISQSSETSVSSKPLLQVLQPEENGALKRKSDSSPERSKYYAGSVEKKHRSHEDQARSHEDHDKSSTRCISSPRDDRFVYGNPKDSIRPPVPPDVFDGNNVLDLSWKGPKPESDKPKTDATYHNLHRNNHPYMPDPFPRSNLEIKLVNTPKRPTIPEQLQIAKLQQQQRRSVQQQQKMLQQMRRSMDASGGRSSVPPENHKKRSEERTEVQKEEPLPHPSMVSPMYPPAHPYYEPVPTKELPDGHPILPLLDPVYFSALYNAHGFMPPSSPSIAAAFISTLQEALPKLSMMFPPNSSPSSSSLLPHKNNENPN